MYYSFGGGFVEKMKFIEIEAAVNEILVKGKNEGLNLDDYYKLKMCMRQINLIKNGKSEFDCKREFDLYYIIDDTIKYLYNKCLLDKYDRDNVDYIMCHSYLLPLVLANDKHGKIKLYGDNSYMFLCQFHQENTPSMGVTDYKNLLFCFGCGCGFNTISYIKEYENLTFKETVKLLSEIYLFDIKEPNEMSDLADTYKECILSKKYKDLLDAGYKRYKDRIDSKTIKKMYDERLNTIERINKNIYDPNFIYKKPVEKVLLR